MRDIIKRILLEETLILEMGKKSNTEDFIRKAKEIHGDKYDYTPTIYINNRSKVEINCPKHGIFLQKPNDHLSGGGCKQCGVEQRSQSRSMSIDEFLKRANEIHKGKYDYSNLNYQGLTKNINFICPIHGDQVNNATRHLSGSGCKECAKISRSVILTKPTEDLIKQFQDIHGDFYDYSQVDNKGSHIKVKIICPIHGEFLQEPNSHLKGIGCPSCGYERTQVSNNERTNELIRTFADRAEKIHGKFYDYSEVDIKKSNEKVIIICPKHGEFLQKPNDHLQGNGCPTCKESRGVKFVTTILRKYNIEYVREKKFKDCVNISGGGRYCRQLPFDIFIPSQNTIIEYDGKQHYEPIKHFGGEEQFQKQQRLDQIKNNYCRDNGIKLIRIPYTLKDGDIETLLRNESVI